MFRFLAWFSIAQSVCQWAFSLLAIRCLRPWVRILHSAEPEEDNLSPFDSNIACLCQSIEINNNKHICIFVCVLFSHHNLTLYLSLNLCIHYNDVRMRAMASQITSLTIVYSTVHSGADQRTSKLFVAGLCVGNSSVAGVFPAQMASKAENVSIRWRHHARSLGRMNKSF